MKGFEDVENKACCLRAVASLSLALWLMLGMLLPIRAYASDGGGGGHSFGTGDWVYGIVEGPKFIPNRENLATNSWGWIIYAPNKYDAALYVCGLEPSEVSSVTAEQRAKLSNELTGGAFYELATHIYKVSDGSIPTWANAEMIRTLFSVEDVDYVFRLEVDDMQAVRDAEADLQTILDGGDLGGAGGSFAGDVITFGDGVGKYKKETDTEFQEASAINPTLSMTNLSTQNADIYTDIINNYKYSLWVLKKDSNASDSCLFNVYYSNNEITYTATQSGNTYNVVITKTGTTYARQPYAEYTFPNLTLSGFTNQTVSSGNTTTLTLFYAYWFCQVVDGKIETGTPVIPPSQWPDTEPETPTQPTVPSPTTISITISSQPTFYFEPTITTSISYTSTTYDGTDYGKQLKSIYDELKAFHVDNNLGLNAVLSNFSEIADGLESLGDDLDQQVSWMVTNLKTDIDTNFGELKNYLKGLFEWLADELDFTVSGGGYSDSTVVSWLKKIWSKMGSGVDTRPTDPTVDPFSALDWLLRFISTLIDGLADKASDLSEDLQDLLDNISDKFPFSIPWDVVAILTLFAGEPVAPAIEYDVPIWGDVRLEADIDLSEYDSVMDVVRPVELIAFAAYLLWLTPEVLDSMDITKGMGGS